MSQPQATGGRDFYRGAGRRFETLGWKLRSYFTPSHIITYWRLARGNGITSVDASRKLVCFDFTDVEIDRETGRYVFILARDFEAAGCLPCFRAHFRFLATMRHKHHKRLLLDGPFRVYGSARELPVSAVAVTLSDHDDPEPATGCHIRVRYDYRWPEKAGEIAMPYFAFPEVYDYMIASAPPDPMASRPWRVFFAGCCEEARYGSSVLPEKFGKMNRVQIIKALHERVGADRIRHIASAADLAVPTGEVSQFVWAGAFERGGYRIPHERWIESMDRAEFFLACPGVEMPLCHNVIEALARGAVPILEHPEYFQPSLEHNENCLVFRGSDELVRMVERAFQMPGPEIQRLRVAAAKYYASHLAPGVFARRLLNLPSSRVELLLNAVRAPRENAKS